MQIAINLDLPAIIAQAVSAERIQPIVDKAINDAIKCAIDDATGYRSDFRNALKEQLAEALPHGLEIRDVAKFQSILNTAVNKLTQECNESTVHAAIERAVKDVLPDVPPVVKMSELLKDARHGLHKENHEAFYAYFEPSKYSDGGGVLFLDADENPGNTRYGGSCRDREDQKYSAALRVGFNGDGSVYSLCLDGKQVTPTSRPNIVGSFNSILMAMYVGRTRLEVDMDDDDIESVAAEQYD